ncbi:MAG: carbamoyltransferase HypF [Gammaproteobacteria bacterium]|nr:carbamoyltransferase HypF [Gammaproteobacteria bacterium]
MEAGGMTAAALDGRKALSTWNIRVTGRVQGVGFRPFVWKIARKTNLRGQVRNDAGGVSIELNADRGGIDGFLALLQSEAPPLARIDRVEVVEASQPQPFMNFAIRSSQGGAMRTEISPDAAVCPDCVAEVTSPFERRFRYPFANCVNCGPRLSIIDHAPWDRANTAMAQFALCPECAGEYENPTDRRFHAQPIACHRCGPKASLSRMDGHPVAFDSYSMLDEVDAVAGLILRGEIVAIKGLGGYHLACDALNEDAVTALRARKRRSEKAFALMARDLDVVRGYASLGEAESRWLASTEAPIVLLDSRSAPGRVAANVAPGMSTLGFMLPYTPLHHLMMRRLDRPVVMTSGNLSDEPQVTREQEAKSQLGGVANFLLTHDRHISVRLDDSVVRRMDGKPALLRRARGYAPAPLPLPEGFDGAPELLALGGELKSTFALLRDGEVILSQHMGDLEHEGAYDDYCAGLRLYRDLFEHQPRAIAVDRHPDYLSTKLGRAMAESESLPVVDVQHHHAHIAACMAENGFPRDAAAVLGIALDGLGYGDDGALWGGEFLLADYHSCTRLGSFKPVPMPGGAKAIEEPWRNTYAHILAEMGWPAFKMNFGELELCGRLESKSLGTLSAMIGKGVNSPSASSCGRLFDAAAAACGVCFDSASFEGEAALRFESLVDPEEFAGIPDELAYPFGLPNLPGSGLPYIEPLMMWQALLGDLHLRTPIATIAARFHKGLSRAIARMARKLAFVGGRRATATVALSGGCFQNRVLLEETAALLRGDGFEVLTHAKVPANDGGLSLGQSLIGAARLLKTGGK